MISESKALREGSWKLIKLILLTPRLTMWVSPVIFLLLKISHYFHPNLQATLIDLIMYQPNFITHQPLTNPSKFRLDEQVTLSVIPNEQKDIVTNGKAIYTKVRLPPKA